jgi:hypothetical protein
VRILFRAGSDFCEKEQNGTTMRRRGRGAERKQYGGRNYNEKERTSIKEGSPTRRSENKTMRRNNYYRRRK